MKSSQYAPECNPSPIIKIATTALMIFRVLSLNLMDWATTCMVGKSNAQNTLILLFVKIPIDKSQVANFTWDKTYICFNLRTYE